MGRRATSTMKQASISEFFEKNKHFLGYDTLQRSIITAVKESIDNSLDACEEHRILPTISIELRRVPDKNDRIMLISQDNGPGIPAKSIEKVFGSLLFGSRFHTIRQTRGQQGIGITGVVMYSQLTTGKTTHVVSKIAKDATALKMDIGLDTKKNAAIVSNRERTHDFLDHNGLPVEHGLRIEAPMKAKFQRGKKSVGQYLRMTAIVNPHATIRFHAYNENDEIIDSFVSERVTDRLPRPVREIKPHPHGIEIGALNRLLRDSSERNMRGFLRHTFSGVPMRAMKEILSSAEIDPKAIPSDVTPEETQQILTAFNQVRLMAPPTDCLSPIEDLLIKKGLEKGVDTAFVSTLTREPSVADGNPFQVEVGLIYGSGDVPAEGAIEVLRFANRVPLMYQQGGCLLTKAIEAVSWKGYGLDQPGGKGVPKGPATILVHLASTNVQFTSEAKEAVADNEIVMIEIRKALQEIGRHLKNHKKKSAQKAKTKEKFELVNEILPAIASKASSLLDREEPDLAPIITKIMNAVFCEDEVKWDKDSKVHRCEIKIHNYSARPRVYSILAQYPEREGVEFVENELGGRREVRGIWCWKLDTIPPGEAGTIEFTLKGLEHNDWNNTEVFFRGAGDIIGASKIDEDILLEIQKEEERAVEEATQQASLVAEDAMDSDVDDSGDLDAGEVADAMEGILGEVLPENQSPEEVIETHDQDGSGTLDQDEIKQAVVESVESRQTGLGEWGDE
ncbi:MAG TPA: DNA topoisomerase VI subunit B [Candidatus Thalassarchaeaceae archaeon]|nr:DNA topoisomerase VI subunit B [Candidatus Thalassarchaeaceae archaeon]